MALPSVGDLRGYVSKGNELLQTAQHAAAGDPAAQNALLADGVTLAQSVAGQNRVAQIAISALGGAASGFVMGGPVGAAAGLVAGLIGGLGGGGTEYNVPLSNAGSAIQARLLKWSTELRIQDPSINPTLGTNNPCGWALYNYVAQSKTPGQNVCPDYLWRVDPTRDSGCNAFTGVFTSNGRDPGVIGRYRTALALAITPGGSDTVDQAIDRASARSPAPNLYSVHTQLFISELAPALPLGDSEDGALSLATVFGMLQAGALDQSIASELLMQRALYDTYNNGQAPSSVATALLNQYVGFATRGGAIGSVFALPPPTITGALLNATLSATASLDAWTKYYLDQGPRP